MIRCLVKTPQDGGEPIVFLGLSDENLTRLLEGWPLVLAGSRDAVRLGLGHKRIVLMHGKTDQVITRELEELGHQLEIVSEER